MKILFLCSRTPLAGMPWRTCKVVSPYLAPESGWMTCATGTSYGKGRTFPYMIDIHDTDKEKFNAALHACDLLLMPSYVSEASARRQLTRLGIGHKPLAWHYSTEVFRWWNKQPDPKNTTVVAQYQARFAEYLDVMPNCIPVDDPMFSPGEKPTDRIIITYTPSGRSTFQWANKGVEPTLKILRSLKHRYKDKIEIVFLENMSYEDVMAAKRMSHIVIDECVTGSYHGSALEGVSCGAATICWIDQKTMDAWFRLGFSDIPFHLSTMNQLHRDLTILIENPDFLRMQCEEARRWMLKNYSEEWQATTWINWHRKLLAEPVLK